MKRCPSCTETKSLDEFYNNRSARDGKSGYCITCWKSKSKDWRDTPEKMRDIHLKRRYKINLEEYFEKLESQGNVCDICGSDLHGYKWKGRMSFCVDHNHKCCDGEYTCGKCVRGLLCSTCNNRLGWLEDVLDGGEWSQRAMMYLEKWNSL